MARSTDSQDFQGAQRQIKSAMCNSCGDIGRRVVVAVAKAADRRLDASFSEITRHTESKRWEGKHSFVAKGFLFRFNAYVCKSSHHCANSVTSDNTHFAGKHFTSKDVAALAGVSQSAVSRCFTPGASIAQQTREKILKAASQLGYRPNLHARTLITGKTRMIGVVLGHLDNLFYPRFLQLMAERLQSMDMQLLLFVADANRESDLMEKLLHYRVDGIVLAATTLNAELARACTAAGIPVVLFNRVPTHDLDRAFHSVQTDHESGMADLTRLLIKSGHTRIAYLAGHTESPTNQLRERGCRAALMDANLPVFAYGIGNYDEATARKVTLKWFLQGSRLRPLEKCPDAVVAADDRMALSVLDTLRYELNLSVPEQVSVVGFDGVPQAAWSSYQLTTYSQPLAQMIEEVIRLLSVQLETGSKEPTSIASGQAVIVPGKLCLRESARLTEGKRNYKANPKRPTSNSVNSP